MFDLSEWLTTQGHNVVPFAMKHPDNEQTPWSEHFPRFVQTERVRLRPSSIRTIGRMFYSMESRRKMATLIRDAQPGLCHVHNIYTQLSPSILDALHERRIPTVMTVHDHHLISPQYNIWAEGCGEDYRNVGLVRGTLSKFHKGSYAATLAQIAAYKFHRFLRIYEKNIDLFVAPSAYMQRQLIAGGFPKEKIRVNHYGIDPAAIEPRYDNDGYMLFVGRLSEEKGVETIIRLARMIPDVTFKIVGRGPEEARLHALGHGLENVEFLGFKLGDELRDLYRGAMGVLLPSRVHEVFPLTTLEAMAAGKPVIASNVGGVPEVVEDRRTGFLVKPLDLHGWVEAVMRLAYDDGMRVRMSREARLSIEQTFHVDRHYDRIKQIYAEALGAPLA